MIWCNYEAIERGTLWVMVKTVRKSVSLHCTLVLKNVTSTFFHQQVIAKCCVNWIYASHIKMTFWRKAVVASRFSNKRNNKDCLSNIQTHTHSGQTIVYYSGPFWVYIALLLYGDTNMPFLLKRPSLHFYNINFIFETYLRSGQFYNLQ